MLRQIDFENVKGYATRENAVKKAEKVLGTYDVNENVSYMIHTNAKGRFIPVMVHYPDWMAGSVIHQGICVV